MKTFQSMLQEDGPFTSCDPNKPVTQAELRTLENYLDRVWGALGLDIAFTRHFLDRTNDARNGKQITVCELQKVFTDAFKRHGAAIAKMAQTRPDIEGIIKSATTKINTPFALNWNGSEFSIVTKTVMRKDRFTASPSNRLFHVEGSRVMGPFEKQVNEACGEPIAEALFPAPPMVQRLGWQYVLVPDRVKFPSYGAVGFATSDEAYNHGKAHFARGFSVMNADEYIRAWKAGEIG